MEAFVDKVQLGKGTWFDFMMEEKGGWISAKLRNKTRQWRM